MEYDIPTPLEANLRALSSQRQGDLIAFLSQHMFTDTTFGCDTEKEMETVVSILRSTGWVANKYSPEKGVYCVRAADPNRPTE